MSVRKLIPVIVFSAAYLLAAAAWIVAIGIGASLGLFERHEITAVAVALAEVDSDWTVETGTIAITVKQLGSDVQGSFADWTAAINSMNSTAPNPVPAPTAPEGNGWVTTTAAGAMSTTRAR